MGNSVEASTFGMKFSFTLVVVAALVYTAFTFEDVVQDLNQDENVDGSMHNDYYGDAHYKILSEGPKSSNSKQIGTAGGTSRQGKEPNKAFSAYTEDILKWCMYNEFNWSFNFEFCNSRQYVYNCLQNNFYDYNKFFCDSCVLNLYPIYVKSI